MLSKLLKSNACYLLGLGACFCTILQADMPNITIRKAIHDDLKELFELDKDVSYEYFLPVYSLGYAHLPLGKNPQYYLDLELEEDKKWFVDCIEEKAPELLWVADDRANDTVAGLIIAGNISDITMEINLLLILKKYRRHGIGKCLVQHALASFPDVSWCVVYPLRFANDDTLKFYQSVGFVNQGIPDIDRLNIYGIPYKDMYYCFTYQKHSLAYDSHITEVPRKMLRSRGIR